MNARNILDSDKDRAIVAALRRYPYGTTLRDLAAAVGLPVGTVKYRVGLLRERGYIAYPKYTRQARVIRLTLAYLIASGQTE